MAERAGAWHQGKFDPSEIAFPFLYENDTKAEDPPTHVLGIHFVGQKTDTYPYIDPINADLTGKHVLITGASRGIGYAMARSYCSAGVSALAITARSELSRVKQELYQVAAKAGRPVPRILCMKVDSTDNGDVQLAARQVERTFGRLDILINNAGILESFKPIADSDPEEWWKTVEVNVKGVYLVTRAFLPLLLKGGDKTIVQVSSIGALITIPGGSSYQITKQAVLRFNASLMAEYGHQGLLAYGIHPGGVATELSYNLPKLLHFTLTDTPQLCGDTIVWLTKEKRDWLADRYISVSWNMEELLNKKDEIVLRDLLKVKLRV